MSDETVTISRANYRALLTDRKRLNWLEKLLAQTEWVTVQDFEQGYRLYTDRSHTRVCDGIREAFDSAIGDDSFF
jgi:hypothetical protein